MISTGEAVLESEPAYGRASRRLQMSAAMAWLAIGGFQHRRPNALRAMQYAPRVRIERVPAVENAAVIPDQDIADAPLMMPREFRLSRMGPQRIGQRLGFLERQSVDICIRSASKVQARRPGFV